MKRGQQRDNVSKCWIRGACHACGGLRVTMVTASTERKVASSHCC